MKVAWQIIVDGNLDNVDADYQGKYAWSTCYNSEEGVTLAEMMAKEQDWVVIFNLKRIEEAVKKGDFQEINGVPVLNGRHGSLHALRPGRQQPARHQHSPDGIHFVANGKLSPTVTVFDARKLDDLFDDKIQPRDVVVAEPELGLGRCTPPMTARAMPTRRCSSTARCASGTSTWPSAPTRARRSTRSSRRSTCTTSRATTTPRWGRPRRPMASGCSPEQAERPLPQRRSAQARKRPAD